MSPQKSGKSSNGKNLGRKRKNTHITKSGQTIQVNKSLVDKFKARKAMHQEKHAERMAGMPKSRVKRFFYRMHPKRLYKYWFSREGAIMALKIAGVATLVGLIFILGVFAYFRKDLPNITDFSGNNIGGSIQYYDKTGKTLLWEDFDAVKRIPVPGEEMSDHIKEATIAIEDQDFYEHGGFDVRGITRAGLNNVMNRSDSGQQGGSTITQQLVKLTNDWTDNRTYTRKIKELILSVELEREYSKDQILTGYLNVAPYGNIEYGVEAAANDYFHKSAKDLDLAESAFLAAIPQSPSVYSPYGPYFEQGAIVGRSHYILDLMVQQGFITQEEADGAKEKDVIATVKPQQAKYANIKAPYFALAAKNELNARFGSDSANRGGWKVVTTVDMELQKLAEKNVADNAGAIAGRGADSAAFVAEEVETGHIVAMVGGTNFDNDEYGKINFAADAFIPPGSTFKPYDYAALIEYSDNAGAGSVLYDQRDPLPGYPCTNRELPPPRGEGNCLQNYDFRFPGPITLRYALGGSRNVPAVKANLIVGTDKVIEMANKLMYNVPDMESNRSSYNCYGDENLTETVPCYGASAIGDGAFLHMDDHVNGFATLSRLGKAIPRTYIMKITDASSKTLYEYSKPEGEQVIRPDTAYIVNDMAADPNASYLPAGFYKFHDYKGWDFAIKTGTTNDNFDGLMASWSPKYATLAWVGHHTRNVELSGSMESMTTPIIKPWMEAAHDKAGAPFKWQKPAGIIEDDAYIIRNHIGIGSVEPSPSKDLYPSWYKSPKDSANANRDIDIVSNKLATECTPGRAIRSAGGASSNIFSVDTFVDARQSDVPDARDDIHDCSDTKPSVRLTPANYNCGDSCTLSMTVSQGTHPLTSGDRPSYPGTVNLIVDGNVVASKNIANSGVVNFTYKPNFNGDKPFKVEVIDSVLYEGSASGTITGKKTGGGNDDGNDSNLTITSAEFAGGEWIVKWSGGTGTVRVFRNDDGTELCADKPNSQCPAGGVALTGKEVYAEDINGKSNKIKLQ